MRARLPATPARSRTFSPARRSPPLCAAPHNLRALLAHLLLSKFFHRPPPLGEPNEESLRPTLLPADSCRTAGIEEMGLHRIRQSVVACNRRPRVETAAFLDCGLPRGTAASSEHRGRQGIKLTTDSGSVWMQASTPRGKDAPCAADSATTCYEIPAATWIETHDAARARGCWRSSHDGQPTVLYCVPTNPGPRSFCARPVRRYRWRRS